ncbi:WAT1-related protein [Cocos nucifera]|uniref:WAT1-related protein n=1 Tax=Cocos nucifera TaxID=13894 RepID=A0A8K0HZC3_COCNU|nr:WAT1-related protein [Cocos nucifera]
MYVISVATVKQGMSHYVLVVYRNAIATAVVGPFALWFERPVLDQNFYYMGAKNTNASFASALYNILPAMTFVNAFLLRMEKIDIKKRHGQAKIVGTLVTLAGALLMILYKGQSHTLKSYPAELSLTTWICFMGAVQSGAVALGIMCSGIAYYIQGVVMKERGPVFVTAFNPLCTIIVAILGSIILAEEITLGRVVGATIVVIGLYSLIWGKSKDHFNQSSDDDEKKGAPFELPISATDAIKSNSADHATVAEIPLAKSP